MAYGLKYSSSAYGLSSTNWKVEIYEKDFTPVEGALPIDLRLSGEGLRIGYDREEDRFNVIYSRYAIIDLKVTDSFNLDTLQFDDERKFLIKIYRDATHEFSGWIIPNYSSQAYEDTSITTITIQAKDSINRLRDIPFVDEHPLLFSHKQSVSSIISQSLRNIGYNLDLDIYYNKYEDGMLKTSSDCPLSQLFVNIRSFKDKEDWISYYEVIQKLLTDHDLRIFQANGRWIIVSPIELVDGSVSGRRFNYLGEQQSNVTLTSDINIGGEGIGIKRNSIIRKGIPIQSFSADFEFGQSRNLVFNGELDNIIDFEPEGWNLSSGWENGEVFEIEGGGIVFDNTYATRSLGINPDVPINDASLNKTKYLESSQANVETLGTFSLSAEVFTNADIDAVRVRVKFYNEGGTNEMYVTTDGKLTFVPTSIYMYNNEADTYKLLSLTWNNVNQYGTPIAFDYMRVSIFEGIRLRAGVPVSSEVKYRNIKIAGRPMGVSGDFVGKRIEIVNTELPNSKKYFDVPYFYKDAELFNEPEHIHKFYLSDEVGEADVTTGKWKRTSESIERKLIDSRLVDRLAMSNRFGDIFEGSIFGYISITNTPFLDIDEKRLLLLYSEFSLGTNTTEIVAIELFVNDFTLNRKEYNLLSDGTVIEVDIDSVSTTKVDVGEQFDAITSAGGTVYGGLYVDYGIDAIPKTSTDPRATNKGTLLFGANNADNIELGNWDNKTLVQLLGGQMKLGRNAMFYEYSVVDGDGTEQYNVGIDAYNTHFEGDIEVVGKVSVGQGALIIEKKLQESGQSAYAEIGAEHYINVTAPEINVLNTLGVNEIVSISEFPIEVNSEVNFNFPIYITDSDEPNSAISRTAVEQFIEEISVNYWKVGGNVDVTGDMVFDIVSAYDGEIQQQPYDYFWKINGTNKMQLSDEALDIKTRIKLKGVSATENQVLTSDGFNEVWSLIGVQSIADIADNYQALLDGVGFVKMNGTDVSYERFGEFGQYLNSSENPNIFDAPWGASYVAGLLTNLPNAIYQGHSIKMSLGEDRPDDATFLSFGLPDENFDSKLYARGIYGGEDTGWKAIGGDISTYIVYRDEAEIELKGYYYEFTEGDRAVFAGIDKTNGTYDILMKSANNLGDTINDYRNYIDTETGRWYFQNGTNVPQKYLLEGEVAGGGSGTAHTLEEPLYFIGNEINIRQAGTSQNGFLTSTDWNTFNDKIADGGNVDNYLNFDNAPLYFGKIGGSTQGIGQLKVQNWNAGADPDFTILSHGIDSDIILLPSAAMIVRSATFAANTSVQGIEVDLGDNHINSIIKINGTNYNFKLPSSPTDGQRFVFEYDSTTNKVYVVAE